MASFFEGSLAAGLSASGWEHSLTSLIGSQRKRTPLHDTAIAIGGLAIEGLPLDCDTNNREAALTLKGEGAPNPEALSEWMGRWQKEAILFSFPKPTLLDEWREGLALMAEQKIAMGIEPTTKIHPDGAAGNHLLPLIRTGDLNPVFDDMSPIFDIPAMPEQKGELDLVAYGQEAHRVNGRVVDDTSLEHGPLMARHVHVESTPDERALSVSVDFQVEGLSGPAKIAVAVLPLIRRRLGWRGMGFEESAEEARARQLSCEVFVTSNDGAAEAGHWMLGIKVSPTDMDHANVFLADGVMDTLNLSFRNLEDLSQAAAEGCGSVRSKLEEMKRRRQRLEAVASVDAAAARHLEHAIHPDIILGFLDRTEADPAWGAAQLEEATNQLKQAPRRVMTTGDRHIFNEGRQLAKRLASEAAPWKNGTEEHWQPMNKERQSSHVFRPGGSHDVERHIEARPLRDNAKLRLTAQVAANLLTPFLHEELREKGGSYGAAMTIKHHSIVLGSYQDPSADRAHATFNLASSELLRLAKGRNDDLLEEARVAVASEIVSPGDGRMGIRDALNNLSLNAGRADNFRAMELADLAAVTWNDVEEFAAWIHPGNRKTLDLTVGPAGATIA